MPAQKRELRKNYIGIVRDQLEEQRADLPKLSGRPATDYVLGLIASLFNRDAAAMALRPAVSLAPSPDTVERDS
jgi:hypothetical protein